MAGPLAERSRQVRSFERAPCPAGVAAARAEPSSNVSVCLPAYERAETLGEIVASVSGA
jgi:hypothetical protein